MAPTLNQLGRWSILALGSAVKAQELTLMPLGASLTYGLGNGGNGYRQFLLDQLIPAGYVTDYVGSRQNGDMADPDMEGWPGLTIAEVQEKAEEHVPTYLPNLYTINVGFNNVKEEVDIDKAGELTNDLVDYLWRVTPDATIILSTLSVCEIRDVEDRTPDVNDQLEELAARLADEGRRVVLAPMRGPDGPQLENLVDEVHLNDEGYQRMANVWFAAIEKAKDAGFLGCDAGNCTTSACPAHR